MASVTLEKVNKVFGRDHIIKDVDLSIGDGEFVVFVGPSGCGKSTLASVIIRLMSDNAAMAAEIEQLKGDKKALTEMMENVQAGCQAATVEPATEEPVTPTP